MFASVAVAEAVVAAATVAVSIYGDVIFAD